MNEANNTQVVKDAYEKFVSGNIEDLLHLFSEDISWQTPKVEGSPLGGKWQGRQEVSRFFSELDKTEDITQFEPGEFISQGDRVVVMGNYAATIKATDGRLQTDWVHIFTVKNGKITSFLEFFDTAAVQRAYQRSATA